MRACLGPRPYGPRLHLLGVLLTGPSRVHPVFRRFHARISTLSSLVLATTSPAKRGTKSPQNTLLDNLPDLNQVASVHVIGAWLGRRRHRSTRATP